MLYLPGIHEPDQQAAALFGDMPGTVVFAEAIGANPNDKSGRDYRWWSDRGFRVLVRLNNGWSPDGTIPAPSLYESFAQRCAAYVAASQGCGEWIIGNEFNHLQERPFGTEIKAKDAARCFVLCRNAIKAVQPSARVIVGAIAPWNPHSGDWLAYWKEMLETIAANGGADGISLHAYTHGSDPSLITSDHRENGWLWHFRTYREQLSVVPASMRHLPVDITETNQGDDAWVDANTGWVQAAMREINGWNQQPGTQKIRSVCLYRWPKYDEKYSFADKAGVQDDFREACKQGYAAPEGGVVRPTQQPNNLFMPSLSIGGDNSALTMPERNIDTRAVARGVKIETPTIASGQDYWFVETIRYYNEAEADRLGPDHHMMIDVLDEAGNRVPGIPLLVEWGSGRDEVRTESKAGEPYSANKPLTPGDFSVRVNDGLPSEKVIGVKMGENTEQGFNPGIHTTHGIVFRRRKMQPAAQPVQPQPTQPPVGIPKLTHPVGDPRWRQITQYYGPSQIDYSIYTVDGVPLQGHNGLDFGTPEGTPIVAVADGVAVEVADEGREGYGKYIKLVHPWGESLYAHLSHQDIQPGARVIAGVQIGLSGNTGNSTGPHLHFGLRVSPFNRRDGWGSYTNPLPFLNAQVTTDPFLPTQPVNEQGKQPPARESYLKWFRQYGTQYGVDWHLLAAMAYSENKYQIEPPSAMGALGLMQFMPLTWQDMQTQLGVTDPLDPEQSIKAAAYYLVQIRGYLLRYKRYSMEWVLAGYNWGMGRAAQGSWEQVPPETKAYIDEILEFSEALRRWEDGW